MRMRTKNLLFYSTQFVLFFIITLSLIIIFEMIGVKLNILVFAFAMLLQMASFALLERRLFRCPHCGRNAHTLINTKLGTLFVTWTGTHCRHCGAEY